MKKQCEQNMGKSSGKLTDWHKQQHKKQLTKNKAARIAARDERVVKEKTVHEIKSEIRKLEQHHKNAEQRPHAIQSKLDRLNKELKLVSAKEEADKRERESIQQQKKDHIKYESNVNFVPLARPEISIYYDAVMNPFGEPPPGQPRLYHRLGGGTTMNIEQACSPQDQYLPPPSQLPPSQVQQLQQVSNHEPIPRQPPPKQSTVRSDSNHVIHSRKYIRSGPSRTMSETEHSVATAKSIAVDPMILPDLPKPSNAVIRSKRTGTTLTADIWASSEEIQYEEVVSAISLEGTVTVPHTHVQWYYRDLSGVIQGPYSTELMRQWNQGGYFSHTTLVSGGSNSGPWKPIKEIKALNEASAPSGADGKHFKTQTNTSIHDRIAALKAQHPNTSGSDGPVLAQSLSNEVLQMSETLPDFGLSQPRSSKTIPDAKVFPPPPPPPPSIGASSLEAVYMYPVDDDASSHYFEGEAKGTENHMDEHDGIEEHPYQIGIEGDEDDHQYDESEIPVTSAYEEDLPGEYDVTINDEEYDRSNSKKKVNVDHTIVALVPSSLRKR